MTTTYTLRLAFLLAVFATITSAPPAFGQMLSWRIEYDDQGRLVRSFDPAGRATKYSYTPLSTGPTSTVTKTPYEGAPVTWQFNIDGQLSAMKDGEGEVIYSYDDRGRLSSIKRKGDPAIHYSYDAAGRTSELRIGDIYRIAWIYDFLGRIAAVETPAGQIRYEYQTGQGVVIRSLPNGVKTFWKRQVNGQLEEITHGYTKNPGDMSYSILAQYTYDHGPDGRIAAIRELSGQGESIQRYSYDTMGRLSRATGPGGRKFSYEYDLVGNRTRATATGRPDQVCSFDWAGRVTTVNGKSSTYDANANLAKVTINGVTRQYRYHPDGRLAEVQMDREVVHYRYDGFGRLFSRKTAAGETRFISNPLSPYWQPLVIDESNRTKTLVIWDGPIPLAIVRNDKVEWLLHDHLGSVRFVVTDAKGNVSRNYEYDPFGVPLDTQRTKTLVPGFAGLFWDDLTGGYLTLARIINPTIGSFLQPDPQKRIPTETAEDYSQYSYCGGDPTNYFDRNGMRRAPAEPQQQLDNTGIAAWHIALKLREIEIDVRRNPFLSLLPSSIRERYVRNWTVNTFTDRYNNAGGDQFWNIYILNRSVRTEDGWANMDWGTTVDSAARNPIIQSIIGTPLIPVPVTDRFEHTYYTIKSIWNIVGPATGRKHWPDIRNLYPRRDKAGYKLFKQMRKHFNQPYENFLIDIKDDLSLRRISDSPGTSETTSTKVDPERLQRARALTDVIMRQIGAAKGIIRKHDISGGDWRVAGPGGIASPNAYAALGEFRDMSHLSSSPVGGIYLSGAGGSINGFGALKGVRLDANGNLILIGEDDMNIELPPLRLDDVVTVFRSVYLHGEGPTVTIDPNPENPEKSAMIIRHGKATEHTYVGWVLYQADRLMKGYGQGVDNITQKDIVSAVPGYAEVLDTIYFGAGDPRKRQKEGIWERFWIVPAEARRFEGSRRELTLFDVPLKVKTQKMKWEKDQLVNDLRGKSSPGALAFTSWFTTNYDDIAVEQYLTPPPESGITTAVPIFAELQRIAVMTAIAEKLRDQGLPMPFWMYDYEIRTVPSKKNTPGMEVIRRRRKGDTIQTAKIFGGVQLSADTKAVKTYATADDLANAPTEFRADVDRGIKLANNLERAVAVAVSPVNSVPLTVHRITNAKQAYQAVSVPGAETLALDPCRLDEIDIVVPIPGGRGIELSRRFNSFFNPSGLWGQGWTLNLPRLVETRIPIERESGKSSYKIGHVLLTPFNTLQAWFLNGHPVLGIGNPKTPVVDPKSPFRNMTEDHPTFLKDATTLMIMLKDGRVWHFSKHGHLVAVKEGPQVTIYERGIEGQVTRIVGLLGGQLVGEIKLKYAEDRKLTMAVGNSFDRRLSMPIEVTYAYDDVGRLAGVTSSEGTVGYRYKGARVTAVTWQAEADGNQPEVLRSYEYNARGQLLSEKTGSTTIAHTISPMPNGVIASSRVVQGDKKGNNGTETMVMHYDQRMRPTKAVAADSDSIVWNYPATGGVAMTVTTSDQQSIKVIDSVNGTKRTIERNGTPLTTAQFNDGGQLINLTEFGSTVLTQEWRPDGQLARAKTSAQGATLHYDSQGLLSSILLHPAKAGEQPTEWQETKFDRKGRPVQVADHTGLHILLGYDEFDALSAAVQRVPDGKENYGYNIKRNAQGRIEAVNSSWGNNVYVYDKDGNLENVVAKRKGQSASVEFSEGQVIAITGFDNGLTSFEYHKDGSADGMPRSIVCPNKLKLEYDYDAEDRLSAVKVGKDRRVIFEYDQEGRMVAYTWEPLKQ